MIPEGCNDDQTVQNVPGEVPDLAHARSLGNCIGELGSGCVNDRSFMDHTIAIYVALGNIMVEQQCCNEIKQISHISQSQSHLPC